MDKYEYNIKSDQIKKLYNKKDYSAAAKIADEIDWRKVKDKTMLSKVADVYENDKQYDKAKEVLMVAYERSTLGRQLAYRLTILSLRTKDFEDADEFYQEFVEMSPMDVSKYILKYRIARAKGQDIKTLIGILEEYVDVEMDERWQYELAKLYHEDGQIDKCVKMCDEIVLWFNEGKYVIKALKLKQLHAKLTEEQQAKLEGREIPKREKPDLDMSKEDFRNNTLQNILLKGFLKHKGDRKEDNLADKKKARQSVEDIFAGLSEVDDIPGNLVSSKPKEDVVKMVESPANNDGLKNVDEVLETEYDSEMEEIIEKILPASNGIGTKISNIDISANPDKLAMEAASNKVYANGTNENSEINAAVVEAKMEKVEEKIVEVEATGKEATGIDATGKEATGIEKAEIEKNEINVAAIDVPSVDVPDIDVPDIDEPDIDELEPEAAKVVERQRESEIGNFGIKEKSIGEEIETRTKIEAEIEANIETEIDTEIEAKTEAELEVVQEKVIEKNTDVLNVDEKNTDTITADTINTEVLEMNSIEPQGIETVESKFETKIKSGNIKEVKYTEEPQQEIIVTLDNSEEALDELFTDEFYGDEENDSAQYSKMVKEDYTNDEDTEDYDDSYDDEYDDDDDYDEYDEDDDENDNVRLGLRFPRFGKKNKKEKRKTEIEEDEDDFTDDYDYGDDMDDDEERDLEESEDLNESEDLEESEESISENRKNYYQSGDVKSKASDEEAFDNKYSEDDSFDDVELSPELVKAIKEAEQAARDAQLAAKRATELAAIAKQKARLAEAVALNKNIEDLGDTADIYAVLLDKKKSRREKKPVIVNSNLQHKEDVIEIFEFDKEKDGKCNHIGEELTKTAEIDIDSINVKLASTGENIYDTANIQAALAQSMSQIMDSEKARQEEARNAFEEEQAKERENRMLNSDIPEEIADAKTKIIDRKEINRILTQTSMKNIDSEKSENKIYDVVEDNAEAEEIKPEVVEKAEAEEETEVEVKEEAEVEAETEVVEKAEAEEETEVEAKEEAEVEAETEVEIESEAEEVETEADSVEEIGEEAEVQTIETSGEDIEEENETDKTEEIFETAAVDEIQETRFVEPVEEIKETEFIEPVENISEVNFTDIAEESEVVEPAVEVIDEVTVAEDAQEAEVVEENVEEKVEEITVSKKAVAEENEKLPEPTETVIEDIEEMDESKETVAEENEGKNETVKEAAEESEDENEIETEEEKKPTVLKMSEIRDALIRSEREDFVEEAGQVSGDTSNAATTNYEHADELKSKQIPEEFKEMFADFMDLKGMDKDIVETLDNLINNFVMDGTSKTNNVIITGSAKVGKTTLGLGLIKAANKGRNRSGRKVAKVQATALNKKGVGAAMTKILGTDMIIEQAGSLMPKTLFDLMAVMKSYTQEMLIILEDDKAAIDRMLDNTPELRKFFNNRLDIEEFEIDDLVNVGKAYALKKGYDIDDIGTLALYAKINDINGKNQGMSFDEIEEIIDDAIENSSRFSFGKLFGKFKKDKEQGVLTEQDFMD